MPNMGTTETSGKRIHFLLIPLMCPGHLIPLVDIARLLAKRDNVTVTIVTTPLNAVRFQSIVERDAKSGHDIRVLRLRFPHDEVGLPEGCESIDTLPSPGCVTKLLHAQALLRHQLEAKLAAGEIEPPPSCMISDKHVLWTEETAERFAIPRILFDGMSCFAHLCFHSLYVSRAHERVSDVSGKVQIPGLPDPIELTMAQLPPTFRPGQNPVMDAWRDKVREGEERALGFVVNSFDELEAEYVEGYRRATGQRVWCVGPVSLCNEEAVDKAERGTVIDNPRVSEWLDQQGPGSVVYVCLGSLNRLPPGQIKELGYGLEASGRPFVWVIRGHYKRDEIEQWLEEDQFEKRTEGRGLLIRGWAPQVLILSHPSVGAFVSHCGWNSTLEGVCSGVPIVTWPLFAEQFFNEKFVVQVLRTGVSVGVERLIHLGEEEKFGEVQVRRERVEEAVEMVMGGGRESQERRERATKFAEASRKAIGQGGSSYQNITLLLEYVMQMQ